MDREEEALRRLGEAQAAFQALGDRSAEAAVLLNVGEIHKDERRPGEALECYREAVQLAEGNPLMLTYAYTQIGEAELAQGRAAEAAAAYRLASGSAQAVRDLSLLVVVEMGLAQVALRRNEAAGAWEHARSGLTLLERMTRGLAHEEEALARAETTRAELFAAAVRAAVALGDEALLCEAIERSRAVALLRAMGARATTRDLTPALREEEERARLDLAAARARQAEAYRAGNLRGIREAGKAVEQAEERFEAWLRRIERDARRADGTTAPPVLPLDGIRAGLLAGEVLVLYAILPDAAHALVVGKEGARRVPLADPRGACDALAAQDPRAGVEQVNGALALLRSLLVEPLGLGDGAKKLLVSPDGPLARIPWPLLVPDGVSVGLVPSGSSLALLRERKGGRGDAVLALGDPAYGERGSAVEVYAGGVPLARLPQGRAEIDAITREGDVRLLGAAATEAGLRRALEQRKEWRAVHLACHGIVNAGNPALSALALTPGGGDDGFLTALEISALPLDSGLAVLSACDTGRGRHAAGEGFLGLARAFTVAGPRRVLVSLWPVDDEATRALMARLYQEWRTNGRPLDAALRAAQDHVRTARSAWAHPYYWGAWVLWGPPE
jgi:hypothetical protein